MRNKYHNEDKTTESKTIFSDKRLVIYEVNGFGVRTEYEKSEHIMLLTFSLVIRTIELEFNKNSELIGIYGYCPIDINKSENIIEYDVIVDGDFATSILSEFTPTIEMPISYFDISPKSQVYFENSQETFDYKNGKNSLGQNLLMVTSKYRYPISLLLELV